jgi:ABC-2 type transport system permease protein
MSHEAGAAHDQPAEPVRGAQPPVRPLYWSLRRELWENPSVWAAPAGFAAFAIAGLVIHAIAMPSHLPGMLAFDATGQASASVMYRYAAVLMQVAAFLIGAFYCLEALSSERRDRSILFWKSLPVSDLTTVLAKALVPLAVVPLTAFAATVAMHVAMLLLSFAALLLHGHGVAVLWNEVQLFRLWGAVLYAMAAVALWHAPLYGFFLLASGWGKRAAALWVLLPLLALGIIEKLTFDSSRVADAVRYRLVGWHLEAFQQQLPGVVHLDPMAAPTPGRLLATPALWLGLVFAAACVAGAVRLRSRREPG